MNYFLTSDWHLGHKKMHTLCARPEDFEDLIDKNLIDTLKSSDIGSENVLIHLGDVSIYKEGAEQATIILDHIKSYFTRTILVRGNHDPSASKCYALGWDFVCDSFWLKIYGKDVFFAHRPEDGGNTPDQVQIHGHLHNTLHRGEPREEGHHILIAQEYLDYRPISLERALAIGKTPMWKAGKFQALTKAAIQEHADRIQAVSGLPPVESTVDEEGNVTIGRML